MIARACLGRPWLFAQAAAALCAAILSRPNRRSSNSGIACFGITTQLVVDRFGEEKGTVLMRKYACCYAQGKRGARFFRTHVAKVSTIEEFHRVVDEYFPIAESRGPRRQAAGTG